jgi:hypothetical protein
MTRITIQRDDLKVECKAYLEVQVDLTGTFQPGCEAWGGGRFERPTNPPEDPSIEDIEIVRLCGIRKVIAPLETRGSSFWDTKLIDLLDGVDAVARAKIKSNVLRFLGDEAARELLSEVDWADGQ